MNSLERDHWSCRIPNDILPSPKKTTPTPPAVIVDKDSPIKGNISLAKYHLCVNYFLIKDSPDSPKVPKKEEAPIVKEPEIIEDLEVDSISVNSIKVRIFLFLIYKF